MDPAFVCLFVPSLPSTVCVKPATPPTIVLLSICWDLTGLATPSRHVFLYICPSRTVFINRPRPRLRSFVCPLGFDRFSHAQSSRVLCASVRLIKPRPHANVPCAYPLHVLCVCVCVCVYVRACVRACVCVCVLKPRPHH